MPNITIRDVPEPVHRTLAHRAARSGQSLQQYLLATLTQLTSTLTMDEWLDQVDARLAESRTERGGGPPAEFDAVELIHQARAERDAHLSGR